MRLALRASLLALVFEVAGLVGILISDPALKLPMLAAIGATLVAALALATRRRLS